MDWLRQDLRFAIRTLRRRPGFSLLAILTLALGLSVNTVAFSAVNALVFKPFRFEGAEARGWLFVGTDAAPLMDSSRETLDAIVMRATTLTSVAAEGRLPLAYDSGTGTEQVWALAVSPAYFSIVRTVPVVGRTIGAGDAAGSGPSVMVSERFWRRRLAAARDTASLALLLNQQRVHVAGVIRDGFQGPGGLFEPDLWVPLDALDGLRTLGPSRDRTASWLTLIAEPRPGTPRAAVEQEVMAIAQANAPPSADAGARVRATYERFADRHPEARAIARGATIGLAAVGLVLLIACFNVAGLVLARSVERRREIGVRAALGAGRWRLARQMLTEGMVLATAGGVVALLLAAWSAQLLATFSLPAPIPQRVHFATDWRLMLFAGAAVVLATLVPAMVPILQVARTDLARWSRGVGAAAVTGLAHRRTRRAFVLLQVAGSTCFLVVALMVGARFARDLNADPGFEADHLAVMEVRPADHGYTEATARELVDQIVTALTARPDVRGAAVADRAPFFAGMTDFVRTSAENRDCRADAAGCATLARSAVGPAFFETMGIRLVAGRALAPEDRAGAAAVVVNATAAAQLWPAASPIGRSLRLDPDGTWVTVVGVAADSDYRAPRETRRPHIYVPISSQHYGRSLAVIVRAAGDPRDLLGPLRQAVHRLDPRLPPSSLQTMADRMAMPLWMSRTTAGFFSTCSAVAVLLSAIGLFGVSYFAVTQRRREFGVRFALGATRGDVHGLVLRDALRQAAPGIVLGVVLAVGAVTALRATVPTLTAIEVWPFVTAIGGQTLVAALASWLPARRAAQSNPLEVLQGE